MIRACLGVALLSLGSCRCTGPELQNAEASLTCAPEVLQLPRAYVGRTVTAVELVSNEGTARASVQVSLEGPFSIDVTQLEIQKGEQREVTVSFSPSVAGPQSGALKIGSKIIEIRAEALAVPACAPAASCEETHFDFEKETCVANVLPEASACDDACVSAGQCNAGQCVGAFKNCADTDACTVESCSLTGGCQHAPLQCPAATEPCKVARCNSATGCELVDADDGTLCGFDECKNPNVEVCLAGECVSRPRPDSGRCNNRWVPLYLQPRFEHAMAEDARTGDIVLFGGANPVGGTARSDTWLLKGWHWQQVFPAASPSGRRDHAMTWDAARERVVLFGGATDTAGWSAETWEWDGTTWLLRHPALSPPARYQHSMAYDSARRKVVLFGGSNPVPLGDTWEWDGVNWVQVKPAVSPSLPTWLQSPSPRSSAAMAFDERRGVTVLFGGLSQGVTPLDDTWEYDGTRWQSVPTGLGPTPRAEQAMAFDQNSQRVVLFGRYPGGVSNLDQQWEWDGQVWTRLQPAVAPPGRQQHGMTWSTSRQSLVVFGGLLSGAIDQRLGDTWEWKGSQWTDRSEITTPSTRIEPVMAWDSARQRSVMFGGRVGTVNSTETWEWAGANWVERQPTHHPPMRGHLKAAFDRVRERLVVHSDDAVSLWEWNGNNWTEQTPGGSVPICSGATISWNSALQATVLVCGGNNTSSTWLWNGVAWSEVAVATAPECELPMSSTFDSSRQRTVLLCATSQTFALRTWEFTGTTWVEMTPALSPRLSSFRMPIAFDSDAHKTLLFRVSSAETWEWDGTSWVDLRPRESPEGTDPPAMVYDEARHMMLLYNGNSLWGFVR